MAHAPGRVPCEHHYGAVKYPDATLSTTTVVVKVVFGVPVSSAQALCLAIPEPATDPRRVANTPGIPATQADNKVVSYADAVGLRIGYMKLKHASILRCFLNL